MNRERAPSGPVKVVVTNRPHSRRHNGIDLVSGVSGKGFVLERGIILNLKRDFITHFETRHTLCHGFHGFYFSLRFSMVFMVSMISVWFPWFPWFPYFLCGFHGFCGFHDLFAVSMVSMVFMISLRFPWFPWFS